MCRDCWLRPLRTASELHNRRIPANRSYSRPRCAIGASGSDYTTPVSRPASRARVDPGSHVGRYHHFLSVSFRPPRAFWILPSALSSLPSAVNFASPSTLPVASLTAPFACLTEPSMRFLSTFLSLVSCYNYGPIWLPPIYI